MRKYLIEYKLYLTFIIKLRNQNTKINTDFLLKKIKPENIDNELLYVLVVPLNSLFYFANRSIQQTYPLVKKYQENDCVHIFEQELI